MNIFQYQMCTEIIAPRVEYHIGDFLGSRRTETAPTSIEVILRPTLVQSDEPSDLRGYLSPTTRHACSSVYSTWSVPVGHLANYEPGPALLNFSDRANTDGDHLLYYAIFQGQKNPYNG